MKKFEKIRLLIAISATAIILSNISIAQPNVEIISIEPVEVSIGDSFTVRANFSWNNISEITLYVDLCSELLQMCFNSISSKMVEENGTYVGSVKIEDERTTYIDYRFYIITADGESHDLSNELWKVNIKAAADNQNNTNKQDENDKGIPSFELAILLVSLSILVFIDKRKR